MIRFESDYLEGAHPAVMRAVSAFSTEQNPGYGEDRHCEHARELIRALCGAPDADVHMMIGGTQTNAIAIAAALRPHQAVISAATGHINVHETGAVEATGHKVLALPSDDGKIEAEAVARLVEAHFADDTHEHMAQPAMVYISQPTENGTIYSLADLDALWATCRRLSLILYIDGARLAYAVAAGAPDLAQMAACCDAFYIGGTKVGLLMGEALVIRNDAMKRDFRYLLKQRGGMLAKGFLLGEQFEALMSDDLYFEIGRKAVAQALRIRAAFAAKGCAMRYDSPTNQQFPILPIAWRDALAKDYSFSPWQRMDDQHEAVRFVASWATSDADVDHLIADIEKL